MNRVVVVGAGPAGLASALLLSRAGFDVTVLEGAPAMRERPCGEGMMPPGVAVLREMGLLEAALAAGGSPFRGIAYFCDGRQAVRADFPRPAGAAEHGLAMRRPGLDRLLLEAVAARARVEVVFGAPVAEPILDGGRVAGVISGRWSFRAGAVLAADGLRSTLRRQLGLEAPGQPSDRFGVCGHFEWEGSRRQLTHVEVHLVEGGEIYRTSCGPGAEGWIYLTSGERVRSWAGQLTERFVELARKSPPLAAALEGARPAGRFGATGPFGRFSRAPWTRGALLVGDAAGFYDPLTGEGLALGLRSAARAAALLAQSAGTIDVAQGEAYERWWAHATRDPWRLTAGMLLLVRNRGLARVALAALARRPEAMRQLFAVNCGYTPLAGLPVAGLLRTGA